LTRTLLIIQAKENKDVNDETYGGSPEVAFDNGRGIDVQTAFKNLSFSNNDETRKVDNDETRKDDNDKTYGDSSLEPSNKNEGVRKFTEKKSITAPKNCNAFMILVGSIYDEAEVSEEQLAPFGNESPKDKAPEDEPLPLFFKLGHPPSPPPEKSDYEKELDILFDEYDFVRRCSEIGSTDFNMVGWHKQHSFNSSL
jgi:DNA repair and recombination RAD54-like protein